MLQYALLWLFHLILALKRFVSTLLPSRQPRPLRTRRRKLPAHLAVLLRAENKYGKIGSSVTDYLESVKRLVEWSTLAGIQTLSIYDEEGVLLDSWKRVLKGLEDSCGSENVSLSSKAHVSEDEGDTHILHFRGTGLPPTPPLSKSTSAASLRSSSPDAQDYLSVTNRKSRPSLLKFDIRSLQQEVVAKRGQAISLPADCQIPTASLTLYILSHDMGKPQLSRMAREMGSEALLNKKLGKPQNKAAVSISSIGARLEDTSRDDGWPCPDLVLIHTPATNRQAQLSPLEFEGFPPWQMHLTEISYISPKLPQTSFLRQFWSIPSQFPAAITERSFRQALDEYDGAEMRFGK